jgi:hypothetical protein
MVVIHWFCGCRHRGTDADDIDGLGFWCHGVSNYNNPHSDINRYSGLPVVRVLAGTKAISGCVHGFLSVYGFTPLPNQGLAKCRFFQHNSIEGMLFRNSGGFS